MLSHDFTNDTPEEPISVADYLTILNSTLSEHRSRIKGEVTQVKLWNGSVFFSLKDKDAGSILNCTIWKSTYAMCGVELEDGLEVIITGTPEIYSKNGKLSLITKTIELVGEGDLKKQYDKLKAKLFAEGLFSPERKRFLPEYPHTIGVITSKKGGVVVYDYINNLKKFGFISKIVDSRVEGPDAIKELYDSIQTLKKEKIDVLVIIRGGGSLESFAPFNSELLVREIVNFPVPVIVGVGHHVDVCLVGMAADRMVSTPTAAANLLSESWEQAIHKVELSQQNLLNRYSNILSDNKWKIQKASTVIGDKFNSIFESFRQAEKILISTLYKFDFSLQGIKEKLKHAQDLISRVFINELNNKREYLDLCWSDKINGNFTHTLTHINTILDHYEKTIYQSNPERQLKLGYSIVMTKDKVVKSVSQVKEGESVDLLLSDGKAITQVQQVIKK